MCVQQSTVSAHPSAAIHNHLRAFLAKIDMQPFMQPSRSCVNPMLCDQVFCSQTLAPTPLRPFTNTFVTGGERSAIRLQATEKAAASSYSPGTNRRGLGCSINRSAAMMGSESFPCVGFHAEFLE
jgi:hypothetical protein